MLPHPDLNVRLMRPGSLKSNGSIFNIGDRNMPCCRSNSNREISQ